MLRPSVGEKCGLVLTRRKTRNPPLSGGCHWIKILFVPGRSTLPEEPILEHSPVSRQLTRSARSNWTGPDPDEPEPNWRLGANEQSRTREGAGPQANESVKKPGTVPSAVRGRDVLSMTYGRRGGLSQGFFTDPNARGPDRVWDFPALFAII